MIARIWRCTVTRENLPRYLEHFRTSVLEEVKNIAGFSHVNILERDTPDCVELTVISHWTSMEAIRAFAGDTLDTAVVAPAARAVLLAYDSTVTHHVVVLDSTSPPQAGKDLHPTVRFSARVPYYHKYRPRYPKGVIEALEPYGLSEQSIVADIGAGTGISAELFLDAGCTVYAVEPNPEMRAACEHFYGDRPRFQTVNGTAEATTLASHTIDWVTAGQAYHWFDHHHAKAEFQRILRPLGRVALFWNDRAENVSPFVSEYNAVMRTFDIEQGSTPRAPVVINEQAEMEEFFAPYGCDRIELPNPIEYDWDGLLGRAISSSYAPLPGSLRYDEMVAALRDVFERHQEGGRVRMDYVTQVFVGRV